MDALIDVAMLTLDWRLLADLPSAAAARNQVVRTLRRCNFAEADVIDLVAGGGEVGPAVASPQDLVADEAAAQAEGLSQEAAAQQQATVPCDSAGSDGGQEEAAWQAEAAATAAALVELLRSGQNMHPAVVGKLLLAVVAL